MELKTKDHGSDLASFLGSCVAGQTELVRRIVASEARLPKTEHRRAWEAARPPVGTLVQNSLDLIGQFRMARFLGYDIVLSRKAREVSVVGCRH